MKIYIPIGSNCEVSFFLQNNNLRNVAFPFDWNCSSLKSIYEILLNNFDSFLDDIFIGEAVNRLYFEELEQGLTKIDNEFIYPVICKKYLILFPHDYKEVDNDALVIVKQKYKRRIERFNTYINRDDLEIIMIYCNIDFNLNDWQKSVYNKFEIDIQKENSIYLDKIKEFYKDKPNIKIISLEEFKLSFQC